MFSLPTSCRPHSPPHTAHPAHSRAVDEGGRSGGERGVSVGLDAGNDLHDAVGYQRHLTQQPGPANVVEVGDCEHVAVLGEETTQIRQKKKK